jgi:hypothetical protein
VIVLQDVPESLTVSGEHEVQRSFRAVIVDELPFSETLQESGYTIEVFRQGETVEVLSVPASWVKVLPEVWGKSEISEIVAS